MKSGAGLQHFLVRQWPLVIALGLAVGFPSLFRALDRCPVQPVRVAALQALSEVSQCAQIGLQSLKDNPTFLRGDASGDEDLVVSGGGYHDHRAAKAIDQMNSVLMDLCVLASRQVAHLLDGVALGLPALLARPCDGVGAEYLAGGMRRLHALLRASSEDMTSQEHAEFEATP